MLTGGARLPVSASRGEAGGERHVLSGSSTVGRSEAVRQFSWCPPLASKKLDQAVSTRGVPLPHPGGSSAQAPARAPRRARHPPPSPGDPRMEEGQRQTFRFIAMVALAAGRCACETVATPGPADGDGNGDEDRGRADPVTVVLKRRACVYVLCVTTAASRGTRAGSLRGGSIRSSFNFFL